QSYSNKKDRLTLTPKHYAYIKISEGCDRRCAYCAIPLITGRHKSRKLEDIVSEVELLVAAGVKEFNIIAQELTYYGIDLYGERRIAQLIDSIAQVKGVKWIRLHYAYPNQFPMELLEVMRKHANVCKYIDIALQHISNNMLQRMNRHTTKEETTKVVTALRQAVPGIHIRTTFMVGYPGETEEDFNELVEFVKWARFERMGAFAYSEEEGTYSAKHYKDDIDNDTKQNRLSKVMRVQQNISAEIEAEKVGSIMQIVIDRKEGEYYIGRTEFSSPEVDPEVLIPVAERTLRKGCFYNVRITSAEEFDLYATTNI
ncbi:MAG: MiaB/RimO family radical SAM methylthiotransferase, partial [Prevotella sp.]|nr:MiaB/RimO family radical SAM methylthiotransferase [Prevotella sp.]